MTKLFADNFFDMNHCHCACGCRKKGQGIMCKSCSDDTKKNKYHRQQYQKDHFPNQNSHAVAYYTQKLKKDRANWDKQMKKDGII